VACGRIIRKASFLTVRIDAVSLVARMWAILLPQLTLKLCNPELFGNPLAPFKNLITTAT